jgi:hypothetical protein
MKLRFAQLSAMTYYEVRMLWRQRVLPVFTLSIIVMVGVLLIVWQTMVTDSALPAGTSNDLARLANTVAWISLFFPPLVAMIFLLGGLVVADVLPRDRRLGVAAIMDSTPLARSTYLLGKLCGGWAAIMISLTAAMLVVAVPGWILIGPYEVDRYALVWLGGAAPIALLHVSITLLLTGLLPGRRAAVGISVFFGVLCTLLMSGNVMAEATVGGLFSPGRPYLYGFYWLGWLGGAGLIHISSSDAQLSALAGIAEVLALFVIVWAWRRAREGRE